MKTINANEFGIFTNEDITENLIKLFDYLKTVDEEKTVIFEKGTYYLDSEKCRKYMLYITNTVGDREFSKEETPHLNAVPFYFGGIDNITFDGGNSVFVIDGKVTNIAMENCKNITLKIWKSATLTPICTSLRLFVKIFSALILKLTGTRSTNL